jgi:hypothetical protein
MVQHNRFFIIGEKMKELTDKEIVKRTEVSRKLLGIPPQEWTDAQITEWVNAGFRLPKVITNKNLDNSKNKSYKKK